MERMPAAPVQPEIALDVQTGVGPAWPGAIECTLRVTVHARIGQSTAFLVELTEAGIFELPQGTKEAEIARFASMAAPAILFPLARRDLAAMVTAAGFQPVVPDHIDFESIAKRIAVDGGFRPAPTPVSLTATTDVRLPGNAARPAAAAIGPTAAAVRRPAATDNAVARPAPAVATPAADTTGVDTVPQATDTQPSFLDTQPVVASPTQAAVERGARRFPGAALVALAVLGVALVAGAWWWLRRDTQDTVAIQSPAIGAPEEATAANASPPAGVPQATPASRPAEPSSATRRAIEDSRERLAALPPGWRSIELGHMDADADLRVLESLPLQAPLYVARLPDGQLQVLYGAYPSQEAAAAALEDARGWTARGLRGEPRIVVPGRSS